ncbi:MAG TPA: DUF5916 domain-containing protein [Geothrix sp.]|nr:DUF5916 domain-containing protein [Geothrix sp.]
MTLRALTIAFSLTLCLGAQGPPEKSLRAVRVTEAIQMDGRLSEAAWNQAPAATGFTVAWPDFGKAAGLPTEVKVLYDDNFVYVGARMHHPKGHAKIIRRLHRRDQDSMSDWFTVYIDSLRDHRTAWGFAVNAAGVQRDTLHAAENGDEAMAGDPSWDGVWESSVSLDADGWTAKLKIPLSLLRIRPEPGPQTWGINFSRTDHGPVRERSFWQLSPRGEGDFVGRFPTLTGIEGIRPKLRREWVPYVSFQRKFETAQPFDDRKWTARAGLDAHLGLSTDSQLDLSIRPDFGQVEVDQAVLNLGTVETYFPEKRPFFLEGMEIFRVAGNGMFYSRRIGTGLSDPSLNPGETLVDRPQASEINGAAKYTAKLGSGLNLGVLGASVGQAKATIRDASGQTIQRELEPLTSFGVMRLQQAVGDSGSYVGGFASFMRQADPNGREAQTQALDGVYRSPDRSTFTEFTLARSQAGLRSDPSAPEGWRGRLHVNRHWESGWTAEVLAVNASSKFNSNDLGYLDRNDEQKFDFALNRKWDQTFGVIRNLELSAEGVVNRDQAGRVFRREATLIARTDFTNFFSVWSHLGASFPAEDDRELRSYLRDDPVKKYLRTSEISFAVLGFDTPGNRPWYVRAELERAWHEGGPSTDLTVFQSIKLNSAIEIQFNTVLTRDQGERKYLPPPDGTPTTVAPMAGLRAMGEFDQTLRIAYALSPTFSIQFFSQWLDANWSYRDVRYYVDDRTLAPGLPVGISEVATASSNRLWNLNLITRWEFRPGSAFFLVYTHGVETGSLINDRASLSPRPDLAILRHLPSDDAVQVKLSWLFR